jgi:hypothetical protein
MHISVNGGQIQCFTVELIYYLNICYLTTTKQEWKIMERRVTTETEICVLHHQHQHQNHTITTQNYSTVTSEIRLYNIQKGLLIPYVEFCVPVEKSTWEREIR